MERRILFQTNLIPMSDVAFINGDSINLVTLEQSHLPLVKEMWNSPSGWRTLSSPKPRNEAKIEAWYDDVSTDDSSLELLIRSGEDVVGMVNLSDIRRGRGNAQVGVIVHEDFRGQGYATEALQNILQFVFDHWGLHKVSAEVIDMNRGSVRLVESVGFSREGTFREEVYRDGQYCNLLRYGILRREWREQRSDS
jgi:RimJ/RimL family protein N-acetyltransferase